MWEMVGMAQNTSSTGKRVTLLLVTHDRYLLDNVCLGTRTTVYCMSTRAIMKLPGKAARGSSEQASIDKARNTYRKGTGMDAQSPQPGTRPKARHIRMNFYQVEKKPASGSKISNLTRDEDEPGWVGKVLG